jgi:hypothetical protein
MDIQLVTNHEDPSLRLPASPMVGLPSTYWLGRREVVRIPNEGG